MSIWKWLLGVVGSLVEWSVTEPKPGSGGCVPVEWTSNAE